MNGQKRERWMKNDWDELERNVVKWYLIQKKKIFNTKK